MAKQVIWSLVAKKQLKEAFQILKLKNGNNEVGEVLYVQLQNILHRISMNPFIGHPVLPVPVQRKILGKRWQTYTP